MNFKKYALDAEAFVNEVANEFGCTHDQKEADRFLRSTLHAFRDQSTPETFASAGDPAAVLG